MLNVNFFKGHGRAIVVVFFTAMELSVNCL